MTETPTRALAPLLLAILVSACAPTDESPRGPDPDLFRAGQLQYPGTSWVAVERPADWGWSESRLEAARRYYEELESASVMIIHRGVLVASWGDVSTRYNSQSMRKGLLGALIGLEVEAGRIDPEATLAEIGLDDSSNPLTPQEKSARVLDLLQSRGGIYVPALYEDRGWKRFKPERGSHPPGTVWYYSNWCFNALGTVFERASGESIHAAFRKRIAEPIGMEDYREKDVHYVRETDLTERFQNNSSEHRAYVFMISTRDMARFGLLYLGHGRWRDRQVVPEDWVERASTETVATHDSQRGDRYGLLWWVSPLESRLGEAIGHASFKTTGGRGHKVVVVPDLDLVVVHRLATGGVGLFSQLRRRFFGAPAVSNQQFEELMRKIVAAHPDRNPPSVAIEPGPGASTAATAVPGSRMAEADP